MPGTDASDRRQIAPRPGAVRGFHVGSYQQYLANPFVYRCHANTGVKFPA
ncbi:hypothetical protein [Nocardioides sp. URHA0032]|nr:hypothetical protein [Nocardioides sp. URHA0032]